MKNILLASSAALVLSVIALMPVSAMESAAVEDGLASFQYSIEQDFYLTDYVDDIALYAENDEADYSELEAEEYGEMICVLYDENDEADYALLEALDEEELSLYDENDEADFLALETMEYEEEEELSQFYDFEETDYLAMD